MHCPYCQRSLVEEAAQCSGCGLQMARLDGVLGVVPVIFSGLNDRRRVLPGAAARRIGRAVGQFRERFPQIEIAVVVQEAPTVVPLRTWAWWVFNRGNFSAALDKGFTNRDILLAIDPVRGQSALTIGYGLEPFVGHQDLSAALQAGQSALAAGDWGEACGQILAALDEKLRDIIDRMPRTYGVPVPLMADPAGTPDALAAW